MNKKLVALAVAGALGLPLAAQAQTANVTLYGRANVDMEVVSGAKPNGTNPNQYRLSSNTSRFGIRGTESLGGGLSAIFQLENSANFDGSGGAIAARETFVGLQGSWGTFKMGNFLAPYDDIHPIFGSTPTLATGILATSGMWANNGVNTPGITGGLAGGSFDARHANSIRYDSPTMSGFSGSIQYSNSNEGTPRSNSNVVSGGLFYLNGPLRAGFAYEQHTSIRGVGLDDQGFSVSAGYNFGVVRPAFVYERLKYDIATGGDLERDYWAISITVPAGPGIFYAVYGNADEGKGSSANGSRVGPLAKGPDSGADNYSVSYTYPLSKRTSVYAGYVKIKNDPLAAYNFGVNTYQIQAGGDPEGWVLGMWHNF